MQTVTIPETLQRPQPATAQFAREIAREWAGPTLLASAWAAFSIWRAFCAHAALQTNAYDLSLFDYTLWSTLNGRPGFVPFMHSIFSHHFMVIVLLMAPIYALWQSPEWLIVIQTVAIAGGALAFFAVSRRLGLGPRSALALMFVLLIARRSHSGAVSYFYFESLQPLLMYLIVLAWMSERWRLFWIAAGLLLTTKEEMPLYLMAFAAVYWFVAPQRRRQLLTLTAVAAAWMLTAFLAAIPLARHLEGNGAAMTNPFIESGFGVGLNVAGARALAGRFFSIHSLQALFSLLASAGLISLAAPRLLLVATPAILLSLMLVPGSPPGSMLGHYALPILPWVFLSAAAALVRLGRWSPRLVAVFLVVLVAGTLADAPIVRYGAVVADTREASAVLRQLELPAGDVIAVQSNLIPHLPHSFSIRSLEDAVLASRPDAVLLTRVGGAWPLSPASLDALIARYQADPGYEQAVGGPLYVFKRRN